jgi:hypothetical protein
MAGRLTLTSFRGRPNCVQDVHDANRRRKYTITTLFSAVASPNLVLFQVQATAEALYPIATSLPEILGCPHSCLVYPLIQQRQKFELDG